MAKASKVHPAVGKLKKARRVIAKTAYELARFDNENLLSHDCTRAMVLRGLLTSLLDDSEFRPHQFR